MTVANISSIAIWNLFDHRKSLTITDFKSLTLNLEISKQNLLFYIIFKENVRNLVLIML